MKHTLLKTILAAFALCTAGQTMAQFTEAGWYRVHNGYTKRYVSIVGTTCTTGLNNTNASGFYGCIKMQQGAVKGAYQDKADSLFISDPGTIIYIPNIGSTPLYAQGVNTKSLTGYNATVETSTKTFKGYEDMQAYTAALSMLFFKFYLQDYQGFDISKDEASEGFPYWWIEPVTEANIDTYYFGVKPLNENVKDPDGYYWTTLCCDFACKIPADGGVVGAYTVKEITTEDGVNYAKPVLAYSPGEEIPGATPVLIKCKYPYASGNKLIPTGTPAHYKKNNIDAPVESGDFPLKKDLLRGNYFGQYQNPSTECWPNSSSYTEKTYTAEYATQHDQSTMRVLNVNSKGVIGFYKMSSDVEYMSANKAWLDISSLSSNGVKGSVYIDFSDLADDIREVEAEPVQPVRQGIYDLSGRRVETPEHGLYIIDGKKVYIP